MFVYVLVYLCINARWALRGCCAIQRLGNVEIIYDMFLSAQLDDLNDDDKRIYTESK